ncbi:hypothetical protein [Candidatus Leptofilum sp.]|uniref:hypothetical protein n=1 Tax=Candidatus Leptofilum sp. TaxID=3241576 RepID=UPI003B5B7093
MNNVNRPERWAKTAVERELDKIRSLPAETNIYVPGNPYWQSLFKIAGIVNGGYKSPQAVFSEIEVACHHMGIEEKEIRYQWRRACQQANPRRLKV